MTVILESLRVMFDCRWEEGGMEEKEKILEGALLRSFWGFLGPREGFWKIVIAPVPKANARI